MLTQVWYQYNHAMKKRIVLVGVEFEYQQNTLEIIRETEMIIHTTLHDYISRNYSSVLNGGAWMPNFCYVYMKPFPGTTMLDSHPRAIGMVLQTQKHYIPKNISAKNYRITTHVKLEK